VTGTAVLRVIQPGPGLLVQDLGRPGWAHVGVPTSGAADPESLALANRLVGNPEDAAGLEVLLGPVLLRAERSTRVAVTGAMFDLLVDGRAAPWGTAVSIPTGAFVALRPATTGLRAWFGVAGGLDVDRVFGSAATDTLTGLGPSPLAAGDLLAATEIRGMPSTASAVPRALQAPVTLRIDLGPRDDWFTDGAVVRLTSTTYRVTPRCDRVGVRLESADGGDLERRGSAELESEGLVTGAVQVPPNGQPLIFGVDHPVTGGFPVVAVVLSEDLAACAQLKPGDEVRFVLGRG
jgi:biotin-dependent carboxylase-like uncharacterized protein